MHDRSQARTSTGLVHSWPVTTSFTMISVDIWSPGDITNCNGQKALLTAMCDMGKWVVSVTITGKNVLSSMDAYGACAAKVWAMFNDFD